MCFMKKETETFKGISQSIDEYRSWAKDYRYDLTLMQSDLELILEGFEIYLAVDFHDIYQYCFPFMDLNDLKTIQDESKRLSFLKKHITRSFVYFKLEKLYNVPILLLPPYRRECDDFIKRLNRHTSRYIAENIQREIDIKLIKSIIKNYNSSEGDTDLDKLVNTMDQKALELIFFMNRSQHSGIDLLEELFQKYIKIDPSFLQYGTPLYAGYLKDIVYRATKLSIMNGENSGYEDKLKQIRPYYDKEAQNKRDAEAIRYVYNINKELINYKKAVILFSSAPHMSRLMRESLNATDENFMTIEISKKSFHIVRDSKYIYTSLLEISKCLGYEKLKESNRNKCRDATECKNLLESVIKDKTKLEKFLYFVPEQANIAGVLKPEICRQNLNDLINLNQEISNIEISLLIKDCAENANLLEIKNLIGLKDISETLELMDRAIKSNEFEDEILKRSIELELKRLDLLWPFGLGTLPSFSKLFNMQITLFNLPFELNIRDDESYNLFNRFLNINRKGKMEIKKKSEINPETAESFKTLLEDLSNRANDLIGDEKYILQQLIFLSLGQYDLLEMWHDQFFKKVIDEHVERELAYLFAINFIRIFRNSGPQSRYKYKKVIEICEAHSEVIRGHISFNNSDSKEEKLKFIESKLRKLVIFTSNELRLIQLTDGILILGIAGREKKLYYIKFNSNNRSEIVELDLRFEHLKSVVFNRFLRDHHELDRDQLEAIKQRLKKVLIPIAKNSDSDFEFALEADYAYLLALDEVHENYTKNVMESLEIMMGIEKYSDDPLWSYSNYYILGYVYYKAAGVDSKNKDTYSMKALIALKNSLNELPNMASNLRGMVLELMEKCQNI